VTKQQIPVVVTVSALVLTLVIWWFRGGDSYGDNNANFPDGVIWLCGDDACNHVFAMTMAELGEHHETHYGEPVACPKCGKTPVIRGVKCLHCKTISIEQRGIDHCPSCGQRLSGN